jgi:predicted DsbA family dithiol-disulfide isomerase
MEGNKLSIPIAIVIAGALIAGALFYTNRNGTTAPANNQEQTLVEEQIDIEPVTAQDHILGNPNADFVIVEYSDTECPFCKSFHETLHTLMDAYGRDGTLAWVYRHFPIEQLHRKAPREAQATECAAELGGNNGFWTYIDRVFETTTSNDGLPDEALFTIAEDTGLNAAAFGDCLESGRHAAKVDAQVAEAQAAGGAGTPFSVLVARDEINQETREFIASISSQLPPRTIVLSTDERRVALNGALPLALMQALMSTLTGETAD